MVDNRLEVWQWRGMSEIPVNWPEVRALAIVVGVREAARRMGISEAAAMKRSEREGWLSTPDARMAAANGVKQRVLVKHSQHLSAAAILAQELKDLGNKSRLSLARGLAKGAESIEHMDGDEVRADAQNVKSLVQSTSIVHGWQNSAPTVNVNLGMTAQRAPGEQPETLEAEWSDGDDPSDDPVFS